MRRGASSFGAAIGDPCPERVDAPNGSTQSSSLPQERYAYAIAFEAAASAFSPAPLFAILPSSWCGVECGGETTDISTSENTHGKRE
jgi:hypothetical protein